MAVGCLDSEEYFIVSFIIFSVEDLVPCIFYCICYVFALVAFGFPFVANIHCYFVLRLSTAVVLDICLCI